MTKNSRRDLLGHLRSPTVVSEINDLRHRTRQLERAPVRLVIPDVPEPLRPKQPKTKGPAPELTTGPILLTPSDGLAMEMRVPDITHLFDPVPRYDAQYWASWADLDMRFATHFFGINPLRDRVIVTLKSASGPVTCVCSNANVHLLDSWDHNTPANFGGDGHGWYAVYYVEPTGTDIDFAGTTGASRIGNFFTCSGDLGSGGTYGDGVVLSHLRDDLYTATFGVATSHVDVTQPAMPADAAFLWAVPEVRTIDDIDIVRNFHSPADRSLFNDDVTTHNTEPPEQDAYLDGRDLDAGSTEVTMTYDLTATAGVFPGSCRVYAIAFSTILTALSTDPPVYDRKVVPFPVEMHLDLVEPITVDVEP